MSPAKLPTRTGFSPLTTFFPNEDSICLHRFITWAMLLAAIFICNDTSASSKRIHPSVTFFMLGNAYMAKGDFDCAIEQYTRAIQASPKFVDAYFNRGRAHDARGELNEAVADYDKALSIDPRKAEVYNNRAIIRVEQNDLRGAIADLDRAITINPNLA